MTVDERIVVERSGEDGALGDVGARRRLGRIIGWLSSEGVETEDAAEEEELDSESLNTAIGRAR